ncbi:MAG TPA: hypothetical protein VGI56_06355 [Galbitalea sp.]
MSERVHLPPQFQRKPFAYADARAVGIGEGRLRGADMARPYFGARHRLQIAAENRTDQDLAETLRRCAEFAPLLGPTRFFSHGTAGRLWGCPLPGRARDDAALHVSERAPNNAPRHPGIVGHQASDVRIGTVVRHGLPVTDPVSTWFALARYLPLDELIAAGDHLILTPHQLDPLDLRPYATLDQLTHRLAYFHGRGAVKAARALRLVRPGAESRPETLLRLLLLRAGLPEPLVNSDVMDAAGKWIGRADLVWPEWRTVVEYDGDQHRTDSVQYDKDMTRLEDFIDAGFRVVKVRKRSLFRDPDDAVRRTTVALQANGWRAERRQRGRM